LVGLLKKQDTNFRKIKETESEMNEAEEEVKIRKKVKRFLNNIKDKKKLIQEIVL